MSLFVAGLWWPSPIPRESAVTMSKTAGMCSLEVCTGMHWTGRQAARAWFWGNNVLLFLVTVLLTHCEPCN